jgi:hypothetical protein
LVAPSLDHSGNPSTVKKERNMKDTLKAFAAIAAVALLVGMSPWTRAATEQCPPSNATEPDYVQISDTDATAPFEDQDNLDDGTPGTCVSWGTNDTAAEIIADAAALDPAIDLTGLTLLHKNEADGDDTGPYLGAMVWTSDSNDEGEPIGSGSFSIDTNVLPQSIVDIGIYVVAFKTANIANPAYAAFLFTADTGQCIDAICYWDYVFAGGSDNALSHATLYGVVPIPAAAWLFGSALVGAVALGYRRKRATA